MPIARPFRCLNVRILLFALAMAGLLLGLAWLARGQARHSPARYALALAEAAVIGWFVVGLVGSIRRLDELERRIHADALAAAATITVVAVSGWGFLAKAGLPEIDWSVWIMPLLTVTWAGGVIRMTQKYR